VLAAQMTATAGCAQTVPAARVPVYGQIVAFPLPAPFDLTADYEAEQDGSYLLENVPAGETVGDWSQMLTLSGAQGAARGTDAAPAALAEGLAGQFLQGYASACVAPVAALALEPPQGGAARAVFAGWIGCPHVAGSGHAEEMLLVVMIGAQDIYTLQWAEHGPASDRLTMAPRWKERLALLAGTGLCDPVPGEAAPYPSCNP
jgi:hypothetical protein